MAEDARDNTSSSPTNDEFAEESNDEETIFTMLFQKCDLERTGLVEVGSLVEYIRKMQLGQESSGEEVYDSDEDVHKLQYNLQLLQAMLECNAVEGQVDEATYTHIIRMWVKDVRDRSEQSSPVPLEVTAISDSEDGALPEERSNYSYGSVELSRESFETTGGVSSTHTDIDRIDLMNSVQDLKLDNRRLQERNQQIQMQMDHSEEHLKELQTDNTELKQKLRSVQQNLERLEGLEIDNAELGTAVHMERTRCLELTQNVEKLEQQLDSLHTELETVRSQMAIVAVERDKLEEEGNAMQTILMHKEELLAHHEGMCTELESQLHECQVHTDALSHTVMELGEANEALRAENAELQTRLTNQPAAEEKKDKPPLSSTPFRHEAPSLHDELVAQEDLTNRASLSPLVGMEEPQSLDSLLDMSENSSLVEGAGDEFSRILQQAHSKINHKTDLIVRELTDLIASQPGPSSSHHSETSHLLFTHDKSFSSFESKLAELLRRKKQLQNENDSLRAELEELQNRLLAMEQEKKEKEGEEEKREKRREAVENAEIGVQAAEVLTATEDHGTQTEQAVVRGTKHSLQKAQRVDGVTPSPSPSPTPPPLSRTRDLSFITDDRMKELLQAGPEEVESRVRDLLLAVDTDVYTLPQRKSEMGRCQEGALADVLEELDQLKEAAERTRTLERGEAVVEGVLQGAEQLRPAMEKLMQTSEQHGYILQEEHCAGCIALLKTHIQHLKDKIASLQQAEEELEGRRRWKLQRSFSAASSKQEEEEGVDEPDMDRRAADEEMKELAFQQAFDSALRTSVSQDLTALKRRQQQVAHQCSTLAERTKHVELLQQNHLKQWPKSHQLLWSLPGSTYRILKGVFLLLFIIVLALLLFLLLVLFYSTVDSCGPRCNRSLLEIMLQPHIQYTRTASAPM